MTDEPINLAVGLSVVAIASGKKGPERREISLGAFQIQSLQLAKTKVLRDHAGTGLMALPPADAAALELRMAVVETGSALPDFDKSKAEVQAVHDALGPGVKATLLETLPSD